MNDVFIQTVVEGISEYVTEYRARYRQEFGDLHFGTRSMDDATHAKWFILKALENPNWVLALPFVEGGMTELRRFERTAGIGQPVPGQEVSDATPI